jgi:hypothetical protein
MTQAEFDAMLVGDMVILTCDNHPELQWSCKKLSTAPRADGKLTWNRMRGLFYATPELEECSCPIENLYVPIEG